MALPKPEPAIRAKPEGGLSTARLIQALAVVLFLALVTLRFLVAPLDRYDEGVIVTKAMLLLAGHVPYRDFWATYGPLDTYLLAAAFKVFAPNIVVERLLGAATVAALGVGAFGLLGVIGLRGSMRLLLAGLIGAIPMSVPNFNTAFLANLIGMIALLAFLVSLQQPSARWALVAGSLTGVASLARPEFCLALASGLFTGYFVVAVARRRAGMWALLFYTGAGLLVTAALWLPVVLVAGIKPVWLDLVTYAVTLYPKARSIPFGQGPEAAVVISFSLAFGVVWLWGALHAYRRRADPIELGRVVALLVAGIAVFTWVRTRADGIHALDAWPLTAVLLAVLLRARPPRPAAPRLDAAAGIAGILLLSAGAGGLAFRDWAQPHQDAGVPRSGISGERAWMPAAQLAEVIQTIDTTVPPGESIWVGLQRNDLVTFNDTMLYFLSARQPGTVYYETLPGLTNSDAVEHVIGCQLATSGVRLVVLGPNPAGEPWNLSSVPGSRYLDQWIDQRAIGRLNLGPYQLVRLTPGLRPGDQCSSSDAGARGQELRAVRGTSPASAGWGARGSTAS